MIFKLKQLLIKLICTVRKHPKEITFWTTDFSCNEVTEWIRCECYKKCSLVRIKDYKHNY